MAISDLFTGVLLLAVLIAARKVDAATCNTPGETCDNSCNEVGLCLANYQWISYENCQTSNKVCYQGQCVSSGSGNPYCNTDNTLACPDGLTEVTNFPSLTDCTSYYECTLGVKDTDPSQCYGHAWNACTGDCTGPLINGECPTSGTACTKVGEVGIAPGYDGQYYTCIMDQVQGLQPDWKTCPNGRRFSLTARRCVEVGTSECTVCGNATRVPGSMPLSATSCSFIYCYSRTNFEVQSCRQGWHYDQSQGGCIYGAC